MPDQHTIIQAQAKRIVQLELDKTKSERAMIRLWEELMGDLDEAPIDHDEMAMQIIQKVKSNAIIRS